MPKVSFITAVKNRSVELEEMLESLVRQDSQDWEAIIVDDHSEEPIEGVVAKFSDSRFKYFRLPDNLSGVSNARNFAVDQAQTEIMITADGDDINWPARAHYTYEVMMQSHCDVFYSHIIFYFANEGKRYDRPFQPYNADLFKMVNFITNPGTAFRKDMFLKVGKFDPEFILSEDYDLYLRMQNAGAKFCYTPLVLAEYRIGDKNVTVEKRELLHSFIQKTRIKNNIPPVDLERVKELAQKEVADDFLYQKEIWRDERFLESKNEGL